MTNDEVRMIGDMVKTKQPIRLLFLDDDPIRVPVLPRGIELHYVRTANEFQNWIVNFGLPDIISFDHDLAAEQYHEGDDRPPDELNGAWCARWLAANGLVPKRVIVHSWNSYGAKRIAQTLSEAGCKDIFVKPFNPTQRHDWKE